MYLKIFWILKKAFKYCFPFIFVNILVLSFSSGIGLAINIVNKNIVNELAASAGTGKISALFIGFVISYLTLYFVQMARGFLVVFGRNFYRLNVELLFNKIFMWKRYTAPQSVQAPSAVSSSSGAPTARCGRPSPARPPDPDNAFPNPPFSCGSGANKV